MSRITMTTIRARQRELISKAKIGCESSSCDASIEWPTVVWLAVKLIEKPRAGNRHARLDERGWETGRWP